MSKKKSTRAWLMALLLLIATFLLALTNPRQHVLLSFVQAGQQELALPVADYQAQEPADPQDKVRRQSRSKRYDRQSSEEIKEALYPVERIWSTNWWKDLPAIPVRESDAVVIGDVIDAQAYLSMDRTGVYSEFRVRVEEVLKGQALVESNNPMISAERFGGAVRFPSGAIQRYRTRGQGMPRAGGRYVLFLKRIEQGEAFALVTGYEVRGATVIPLDGAETPSEHLPFDSYRNAAAASFVMSVRAAVLQEPVQSPTPRD